VKLLVLDSKMAHGLDFVMRAQRDGHEVRWFVPENEKTRHVGEGLADIVRDFNPSLKWCDLCFVTDNTTYLRNIDAARKEGCMVVGATSDSAEWELDRSVGMEAMEGCGVPVPEYCEFDSYDDAIAFVKKHDRPFVSKPSGDADKALSYVAKTPADLVYMLQRWKANNKLKGAFILQEKIDGIEMAVGGWIGPEGFNDGFCENFEFKKLCTGDLGCATGEQGTVLRYVKKSKLARKVLLPFEEELVALGHTGYVDVNCIIDGNGVPWPLEFTMRPGWPTFQIQQELHQGDCVEWLRDLVEGEDAHNLTFDDVALGVVVAIPDYPYSHITRKEVTGVPLYGLDKIDQDRVHLCEAMMCEAPDIATMKPVTIPGTAGDYVMVLSSKGHTVQHAKQATYKLLTKLNIPNSPMWRIDIGDRLRKQLPELQSHGYATGMDFAKPKPPAPQEEGEVIGGLRVVYV
jgi:phosphoribosylamine---glycine ligase